MGRRRYDCHAPVRGSSLRRLQSTTATAIIALCFACEGFGAVAEVGSFFSLENAERERESISRQLGLPLRVVAVDSGNMRLFRIVSEGATGEVEARMLVKLARTGGIDDAWYWTEAPVEMARPQPAEEPIVAGVAESSLAPQPETSAPPEAETPVATRTPLAANPATATETEPEPATVAIEPAPTGDSVADPWIAFHDFSGSFAVAGRWYPNIGAHPGQRSHGNGFVVTTEFYLEDAVGRSFTLAPFFRYDAADSQRTHADLHEAYLLLFGEIGVNHWELRLGLDRVFWGVTESQHLVDIVNQIDLVEHPNEKARLGQLMAHLTWSGNWGTLELFGLTWHRGRTSAGRSGRPRLPLVIDDDHAVYESGAEEWHFDVAARYSNSFGPFDVGLSAFDGTSREPFLLPVINDNGAPILVPNYAQIRQFGLDTQLTTGSWLFKLEAIHRAGARNNTGWEDDFAAFVFGGEYTLYSILGSSVDLSLLGEWNYDQRRRKATNRFQNDLFFATRLGFNDVQDSEIIGAVLTDMDYNSNFISVEFNRRLTDNWSVHLETVILLSVGATDLLYATRRDSFVGLDLTYNF